MRTCSTQVFARWPRPRQAVFRAHAHCVGTAFPLQAQLLPAVVAHRPSWLELIEKEIHHCPSLRRQSGSATPTPHGCPPPAMPTPPAPGAASRTAASPPLPTATASHAVPVQRPAQHAFAVVGGQRAAHLHRFGPGALAQVPAAEGLVAFADEQARVARQVAWGLGLAGTPQVGRRSTQHAAMVGQQARGQAAVGQFAKTDLQVETLLHDVHRAVGQVQLHLHVGIAACELRQQRRDVATPEAQRGADAHQGTAWLPATVHSSASNS
jgi:hypothetical protein